MRTMTTQEPPIVELGVPGRGRWIWVLSGLGTMALLAWPIVILVSNAGNGGGGQFVNANPVTTRTVIVTQPVTSLSVESYGAPIQVTAGAVRHVSVTEAIGFPGPGPAPAVTDAVSAGRLTLASPGCADNNCSIGFTVTVPSGVSVTAESDDGGISVSGVAGANLDSSGGPVQASHVDGPLTVTSANGEITVSDVTSAGGVSLDSGGGPIQASHINGPLTVTSQDGDITASDVTSPGGVSLDSGGGPIQASRIDGPLTLTSQDGNVTLNGLTGNLNADTGGGSIAGSVKADRTSVLTEDGPAALSFGGAPGYVFVDTGGGPAQLSFDQPPTTVMVTTSDGSASLSVPGGPYAVTASTEGASSTVDIPTSAAAHRSLTVDTGGAPLEIVPS